MVQFEYLVCSVQQNYVTFVNGQWQGKLSPRAPGALETCPKLWGFLREVGNAGWELVSVTTEGENGPTTTLTTFYLKREKFTQT